MILLYAFGNSVYEMLAHWIV